MVVEFDQAVALGLKFEVEAVESSEVARSNPEIRGFDPGAAVLDLPFEVCLFDRQDRQGIFHGCDAGVDVGSGGELARLDLHGVGLGRGLLLAFGEVTLHEGLGQAVGDHGIGPTEAHFDDVRSR